MAEFSLPVLHDNPLGWGPPSTFVIESLSSFPLETILKNDKIGRVCDFSVSGIRAREFRNQNRRDLPGGAPQKTPEEDDDVFQLVDTRANALTFRGRGFGARGRGGRGRGRGMIRGPAMLKTDDRFGSAEGGKGGAKGGLVGKGGILAGGKGMGVRPRAMGKNPKGKGRGRFGFQRNTFKSYKEWSIQTKPEWDLLQEIPFIQLSKLQIDSKKVQVSDLVWCGKLNAYDKAYDKLAIKSEKPLGRFEDLHFYNVTSSEDPVLDEFVRTGDCNVIITDHILSALVAGSRSIYSWDIIITKIEDKIFFDKRDNSNIDFLTVNETAMEPPSNEDKDHVNAPMRLNQEASCINQNFSQQVLDLKIEKNLAAPNPFHEDEEYSAASGAYRYRKVMIPGDDRKDGYLANDLNCVIRCEVGAYLPGSGDKEDTYVSCKALNEYEPKVNMNWRKHLDTQRGNVTATEMKNNAFRLARWTVQAMVSDCKVIKFGYVSRCNPKDPYSHSLLTVHTQQTDDLSSQIGMHFNNIWGILRSICDTVMGKPNGKYLLVKDPNKSIVRLYSVPWETFDEEDEDEEEDDE